MIVFKHNVKRVRFDEYIEHSCKRRVESALFSNLCFKAYEISFVPETEMVDINICVQFSSIINAM